ncbi:MAG TPA: SMP-30/gluconolactonase/LRE family protein [Stellaceae bacterium]|nr:SMP-30/gluconolactonase/LRE family protein [Stellaceae bacterium]
MRREHIVAVVLAGLAATGLAPAARGWDRGDVDIFAVLPKGSTGPEGLTVGPRGNVLATSFGFNSQGAVTGNSRLFVFAPDGQLIRQVAIEGSTPHTLGLAFNPVTHKLIVLDFGAGTALQVDPRTGASTLFMTASTTGTPDPNTPGTDPTKAGLNAVTFDAAGNVYISDSFQGIIWKTGPKGGTGAGRLGTIWVEDPTLTTTGYPPFGANGIEFNNEGTILYADNTGTDQIVTIPVNTDGSAGKPAVFVNSINGADGLAIDGRDNLWVVANQADEIDVLDPTGKVIAKLGDFAGIKHGVPQGLLFPASPAFSPDGRWLYVSNIGLDLRVPGLGLVQAIDSQWAHQVTRYTISRLRAKIPPLGAEDNHGRR